MLIIRIRLINIPKYNNKPIFMNNFPLKILELLHSLPMNVVNAIDRLNGIRKYIEEVFVNPIYAFISAIPKPTAVKDKI